MDAVDLDTAIAEIATSIREGTIVPFIGAGACQRKDGNCPPIGSKLCKLIAQRLQYSSNGDMPLGDIPLSTVAQHYQLKNERDELIKLLSQEIGKDTYLPSLVQEGLAKITKSFPGVKLVITTNYDALMEKAFGPPIHKTHDRLVQYPNRPNDQIDYEFREGSVALYKMHGSLDERGRSRERDSLVITDDDYLEFLANMQQEGLIPRNIKSHVSNRHLLFLGYGLQDWDFMVLYKSVIESKHHTKIKKSYTIQKPFVAKPPGEECKKRYWENTKKYWLDEKNIHTLEIDQDEFMPALLTKLGIT